MKSYHYYCSIGMSGDVSFTWSIWYDSLLVHIAYPRYLGWKALFLLLLLSHM